MKMLSDFYAQLTKNTVMELMLTTWTFESSFDACTGLHLQAVSSACTVGDATSRLQLHRTAGYCCLIVLRLFERYCMSVCCDTRMQAANLDNVLTLA